MLLCTSPNEGVVRCVEFALSGPMYSFKVRVVVGQGQWWVVQAGWELGAGRGVDAH